jgi:hypothetical protein
MHHVFETSNYMWPKKEKARAPDHQLLPNKYLSTHWTMIRKGVKLASKFFQQDLSRLSFWCLKNLEDYKGIHPIFHPFYTLGCVVPAELQPTGPERRSSSH